MRHGRKQIRLNTTDKNKEQVDFVLPCEQRLHFRGMSWRAKSSLCRQPFSFLSCMRKIRHAIRKQPTSCPGIPFVMRWKNRDPWPIGFQDQFLLAVERQKRNNRKSRKPTTWQNLRKHQVKQQPGFVEPATKT